MIRYSAILLLTALTTAPVLAADTAHPVVVELYQSQGCSSCPPAIKNINIIAGRPDVLALTFAVTYWDQLGWKDTFAKPAFTSRQWDYAHASGRATRALSPHGTIGERILLSGPVVTLKPELTVAFALALHELATNAAKYGALSNETGTVTLVWAGVGEGDDATLTICWREQGGPPVSPPERKGFGSVLIERSLRSYFSGKVATDYRPEGLVFELQARLEDAAVVTGN